MRGVEPQTEDFLRLHRTVLGWVAREADPNKTLVDLCGLVGDLIPGGNCVVMSLDPDSNSLVVEAAPGLEPELVEALTGIVAAPGVDPCADGVHAGEPVFCEDTSTDTSWASARPLAERFGIRACWSIPLSSNEGEILGTFAIVHPTTGGPTPGQEELLCTGGSLAGIVVARRRMRERLQHQRWLVETILGGTDDVIFVKDAGGRYLLANSELARSLGLEPKDLLGKTDAEFFPAKEFAAIQRTDAEVLEGGRTVQYEFEIPGPAGGMLTYMLGKTPLRNASGETHGLIGIGRDVTALRKTQIAVQESQRLESLGVLTGGIAHDFNNLLTGVLGHAELSLSRKPGDPRNEVSLREISRAAARASELIEQMLSYAGQREGEPRELDLEDFVADSSALLNASVAKNVSLNFDIPAGVGAVLADPLQLQQVLMSLLTNASESLDGEPGKVVVRARVRSARPERGEGADSDETDEVGRPSGFLELTVEDQGCGIAPEVLPHIFDPFFSTKFSGRGLGLAAARGIIKAHGGWIEVESQPGQGSVLRVMLPVSSSAKPAAEPPQEVVPRGAGTCGTILIADDEEVVRNLTAAILEDAGYEVLLAVNGEQAVRLVEQRGADLVLAILDRSMPILSGLEAFKKIRAVSPDLDVVLTSGYPEAQATAEFEPGDLVGYLKKPYRPSRLLAMVHTALGDSA